MKVLNKILGDGASKLLESAGSIVDNLVTTDAEKKEAKRKLKELVLQHKFRDINKIMPDGPQDKHLAVKFYK